jgi:hypothetical protein
MENEAQIQTKEEKHQIRKKRDLLILMDKHLKPIILIESSYLYLMVNIFILNLSISIFVF